MADTSLYFEISESIVDGSLPEDFSLPADSNEEDGITWADGAFDGVCYYHMGSAKPDLDALVSMADALFAASKGDYAAADDLFREVSKRVRALGLIDELQRFVVERREQFDSKNLLLYADHLITETTDRELRARFDRDDTYDRAIVERCDAILSRVETVH